MIRGVLFDSGGVLVRPVGGRWNPRLDFEAVLLRHHPDAPQQRFAEAFAVGEAFLADAPSTPPRDDYHRAILSALGLPAGRALLDDLDRPLDIPVLEPYPEARDILDALTARGVPMAIVSDNWVGAEVLYRQLDLEHHFTTFVTSQSMGCTKPDPRMYAAGAEGLGLSPEECLFVDDIPELVAAAVVLGYQGAAVLRDGEPDVAGLTCIRDLRPVLEMVGR